MQHLIEWGVNVVVQDIYRRATPLHLAAELGHERIVRRLLSKMKPADIAIRSPRCGTALQCAARNGHTRVVEILSKPPPELPELPESPELPEPPVVEINVAHRPSPQPREKHHTGLFDRFKRKDRLR